MDNAEKAELRSIILREVPAYLTSVHHIAKIHRIYAPHFKYAAFRRYWKALRGNGAPSEQNAIEGRNQRAAQD
jgi:hypothetical protein